MSCDGFQDTSKITTRLAATRLIPKPPAFVDIKNNLKMKENQSSAHSCTPRCTFIYLARVLEGSLNVLHQIFRLSHDDDPSKRK
jgi:hypothetical protein